MVLLRSFFPCDLTMTWQWKLSFAKNNIVNYLLPLLSLAKLVETSCLTGWFMGVKHKIRWLYLKNGHYLVGGKSKHMRAAWSPSLRMIAPSNIFFLAKQTKLILCCQFLVSWNWRVECKDPQGQQHWVPSPNRKETLLPPLLPNAASHPVSAPVAALRPEKLPCTRDAMACHKFFSFQRAHCDNSWANTMHWRHCVGT